MIFSRSAPAILFAYPAAVAVRERGGALLDVSPLEAPDLTLRQPEQRGSLSDAELAGHDPADDHLSFDFVDHERLPLLPMGTDRVAGQNSLTKSLAVHRFYGRDLTSRAS